MQHGCVLTAEGPTLASPPATRHLLHRDREIPRAAFALPDEKRAPEASFEEGLFGTLPGDFATIPPGGSEAGDGIRGEKQQVKVPDL